MSLPTPVPVHEAEATLALLRAKVAKRTTKQTRDRSMIVELERYIEQHKLPVEPGSATTLRFARRHERGGKTYMYAAVNASGRWFTTGSTCPRHGYSWAELVDEIRGDAVNGIITVLHLNGRVQLLSVNA